MRIICLDIMKEIIPTLKHYHKLLNFQKLIDSLAFSLVNNINKKSNPYLFTKIYKHFESVFFLFLLRQLYYMIFPKGEVSTTNTYSSKASSSENEEVFKRAAV